MTEGKGYGMKVVRGEEWNVSTTTGSHIDGAILNVFRIHADAPNQWGGKGTVENHPTHDGLIFPTRDDALAYGVTVGLLFERGAR